jgi:FkbM family methyltransferase
MINVKLINGSTHTINLDTPELLDHFNDTKNCTIEILHQLNNINYYNDFISKDDKIILDIGGNIGLFSIHVSPYADKIITVEPTPSHFDILTKLTSEFKNIQPINAALSNKSGTERFYTCDFNSTMNSLINRGSNYFDVKSVSFKDLMEMHDLKKVDFAKIDIEGSEVGALDKETINFISDKVNKILIEFHDVGDGLGFGHKVRFGDMLEKYGYKLNYFAEDALFVYKL